MRNADTKHVRVFSRLRDRRTGGPLDDVALELIRLTYEKLLVLIVVSGVSLVGTTAALARYYHDRRLMQLTLLMLVVCATRIAIAVAFIVHGRSALTMQRVRAWNAAYSLSLVAFATLMAAMSLHNFRYHLGLGSEICIIGTFAYCNGMAERLGARPGMTIASGLIMLSALAAGIFASPEPIMRWAGVIVIFYMYTFSKGVNTKFQILVEQLRGRRILGRLADHDMLTSLANRRFFTNSLEAICRANKPFAVLYIDLDRFKYVNDTFGHATGDALLIAVSARLKSAVRDTDLIARLGGDEFAILCEPMSSKPIAQSMAERINDSIARPFEIDGKSLSVSASIGICTSENGATEPADIVRKADEALYRVKQRGRGTFAFA